MDFSSTSPVRLFCANCGAKIIGYKCSDGALRIDFQDFLSRFLANKILQ